MENHNLIVDSVLKSFNNSYILSDIYLHCKTNEVIGLFGSNGAGKSTLLKIIYGLEAAENKFVKIDNIILEKAYLYKNLISFLPQSRFIPKHFTVLKSIQLFTDSYINDFFLDDEIINSIKLKKINNLSHGESRYLEIKLILFSKTMFSFLDEPFSGLSPIQVEKIKSLIFCVSKFKGIIVTDHDYKNVLEISTKLYLLKKGRLILLKNEHELKTNGYLPNSSNLI